MRDLLSSDRTKAVRDLMRKRFVIATEEMDREAVANWQHCRVYVAIRFTSLRAGPPSASVPFIATLVDVTG